MLSSATSELCAINEALKYIASQDPQKTIILTDSCMALQRLDRTGSRLAADTPCFLVLDMERKGFCIAFQRAPPTLAFLATRRQTAWLPRLTVQATIYDTTAEQQGSILPLCLPICRVTPKASSGKKQLCRFKFVHCAYTGSLHCLGRT